MWRYLILAGSFAISAMWAPDMLQNVLDRHEGSQQVSAEQQNLQPANLDQQTPDTKNLIGASSTGRKFRIKAGRGGHYYTDVHMNNRTVKVLIDTGATMVAINESTARKIGIRLKSSDFKYKVNTANGTTKMAMAIIREIKIGNIRVHDVRAGVARDSALSTTLLGMSFLNKLKRFEVSRQTLLLEQ